MNPIHIADWEAVEEGTLVPGLVGNTDIVVARYEGKPYALYGRCLHRGALLADGSIQGQDIICGLHGWDYRVTTGISAYNNPERLQMFRAWVDDGVLLVDGDEIAEWEARNPQPYDRAAYQGPYQDPAGAPEEPHVGAIRSLAAGGLASVGRHGEIGAMGVPRDRLPRWDDIQLLTAQLATTPLHDDAPVEARTVIGPRARKPLELSMPLFVSDMSFGSLSPEAKVALARGAEQAGTGICSGEGGMLPEEEEANSRYFYEYASGKFGFSMDKVQRTQAFHFKFGQAAKTGTGGHLPAAKVTERIAEVRGLEPGEDAVSPSRFDDLETPADFARFAAEVREATGGIPIGAKLSAQHIEDDIDAALEIGVDYIILDGRGGGTGAAPLLFRDNISVPTIPALARARRRLQQKGRDDVTLVITGGLRTPADFAKALSLGADAVAIANSAIQAIGCLGMRACHTNNCPVGIATQKESLRARLPVDEAAERLARFLKSSVELMSVLARACGHSRLSDFTVSDLTTFQREMAHLTGIRYGGVGSPGLD